MTEDTKLAAALQRITNEAAKITPESREEMLNALGVCRDALNRAAKRAVALSGEWQRVEFAPATGPAVEFTGAMLRRNVFDVDAGRICLEVWQTEGGSLVAVDSFDNGENGENIKVCTPTGEIQDQQLAIMEFFGWTNRARSMARKLGWIVRKDIE